MASLRSTLLAALVLVGCADSGGQTLIVLNNGKPGAGCEVAPTAAGAFIPAGRIDAIGVTEFNSSVGYIITPTIENIADSADGTLTSQRTVLMQGARVDIPVPTHADGTELIPAAELETLTAQHVFKFTAPFSGSIAPDGGLSGVAFELVPMPLIESIGAHLADRETVLILATFQIFGHTVNGSGVEADEFVYPITVCNGCLFTHFGSCFGLPDAEYPAGGACNLFQDEPSTCCTSSTLPPVEICPAVPETIQQ
jgi:hypothetical protein